MNAEIERHLKAESSSDSLGYFTAVPGRRTAIAMDSGDWSMPDPNVTVVPLAGVSELLDLARAQAR